MLFSNDPVCGEKFSSETYKNTFQSGSSQKPLKSFKGILALKQLWKDDANVVSVCTEATSDGGHADENVWVEAVTDQRKQEVSGADGADGAAVTSALTAAADGHLAALGGLGAAATLRHFLVISSEQSFDLWGDLPLIHGRAPLLVLEQKQRRCHEHVNIRL